MTYPPHGLNNPAAPTVPPQTPFQVVGQAPPVQMPRTQVPQGWPPNVAPAAPPEPAPGGVVPPMEPNPATPPAGAPAPPQGAFAPDVHSYVTQRQQQHAEELGRVQRELADASQYKEKFLGMAQNPNFASAILDYLDGKPAPGGPAHLPQQPPGMPGQNPYSATPPIPEVDQDVQSYVNSQLGAAVGQLKSEIVDAFRPYQQRIEQMHHETSLAQVQAKYPDVGSYAAEIKQMLAVHPTMDVEMAYRNVAWDKSQMTAMNRGKEEGIRLGAIQAMAPVGTAEPAPQTGVTQEVQRRISQSMKTGNTYDAVAAGWQAALASAMA